VENFDTCTSRRVELDQSVVSVELPCLVFLLCDPESMPTFRDPRRPFSEHTEAAFVETVSRNELCEHFWSRNRKSSSECLRTLLRNRRNPRKARNRSTAYEWHVITIILTVFVKTLFAGASPKPLSSARYYKFNDMFIEQISSSSYFERHFDNAVYL
jgi:hypothetical protein